MTSSLNTEFKGYDFNDALPQDAFLKGELFDLDDLTTKLRACAEHWVPDHFPNGKRLGPEWRLGDIRGSKSAKDGSCCIRLTGKDAGSYCDFATDETGGPFQTLEQATGLTGRALFEYAADLVEGLGSSTTAQPRTINQAALFAGQEAQRKLEIDRIWSACVPCGGNAAEAYLSGRGLPLPSSTDLLFHTDLTDFETARGYPALVAAIRDESGEIIGLHRTYLTEKDNGWRVQSRKMLGKSKGGWVCLQEGVGDVVVVAEGIETALSAGIILKDVAIYACLSANGVRKAPIDAGARDVLIVADNDKNDTGATAAKDLADELTSLGIGVSIAMPQHEGDDLNDVLRRDGIEAAAEVLFSANLLVGQNTLSDAQSESAKTKSQRDAAKKFRDAFENRLRFAAHVGKWFVWNGNRWRKDETEFAFHLTANFCEGLEGINAWDRGKASFISSILRIARTEPIFTVNPEQWNANPWLLGTPKGTVDLKTGHLKQAEPKDFVTKQVSVTPPATRAYQPKLWLQFLSEATCDDQALISYLQRICGYLLTGVTSEHALFFVYGSGGNGKSVFLNTIANILGDYARTAAMETFTSSASDRHPTELAMLEGARLVSVSETEEGRSWAESRIKQLTGGDKVSARFMRQDFFEYTPQFKLLIVGNHKPVLRNVDEAAKRRFNIIPFVHKPATPDLHLEEKLKAEYPQILRWMIDGCLAWQRDGLAKPDAVRQATEAYFDDQDVISIWLTESCDEGELEWEATAQLFASWKAFAEQNGERSGSVKSFSSSMIKRGFTPSRKRLNGKVTRVFLGVAVRIFADPATEAHNR